jgi:hypothetical protein
MFLYSWFYVGYSWFYVSVFLDLCFCILGFMFLYSWFYVSVFLVLCFCIAMHYLVLVLGCEGEKRKRFILLARAPLILLAPGGTSGYRNSI